MQDSKDTVWEREFDNEPAVDDAANDREAGIHAGDEQNIDGWQQYRRWISKAPAPRSRRTGIDPSLYTWKGYRSWAEQVKRKMQDS